MGKKKASGKTYTSKGVVGKNAKLLKSVRAERSVAQVAIDKFDAYLAGKKAYVTIDNPNTKETAKRKIRVPMRDLYGDPKLYMQAKTINSA